MCASVCPGCTDVGIVVSAHMRPVLAISYASCCADLVLCPALLSCTACLWRGQHTSLWRAAVSGRSVWWHSLRGELLGRFQIPADASWYLEMSAGCSRHRAACTHGTCLRARRRQDRLKACPGVVDAASQEQHAQERTCCLPAQCRCFSAYMCWSSLLRRSLRMACQRVGEGISCQHKHAPWASLVPASAGLQV